MTSASLKEIAESSARRNARIGVTGLLLYGSGNYFQLVEGGETAVKALYRRIGQDNRHHHMKTLFEGSIGKRIFPQWQMGQLNLDEPGLTPADHWSELNQPAGLICSDHQTPRDRAIAWVREFIEHHGSNATKPTRRLTGS